MAHELPPAVVMRAGILGVSLFTACSWFDDGRHLDELGSIELVAAHHAAQDELEVELDDGPAGGECLTVSRDVEVSADGWQMEVRSRGERVNQNDYSGDPPSCVPPTFVMAASDLASLASNRVVVTDGTTEIVAEFASFLTVPSMTVEKPADGVLRQGDVVVLRWWPEDHHVLELPSLSFREADLADGDYGDPVTSSPIVGARVDGNRLSATIPQVYLDTRARLGYAGGYAPVVRRCDGADLCLPIVFATDTPSVTVGLAL